MTGKISVIMPVYHAEKYLKEAVESVLKQTYQNWELLLVVRKSEDKSAEIAEGYAKECEQICLIEHEEIGAGRARNIGLREAKGEYIVFIDADDYLPDVETFSEYATVAEKISSDIFISNYARLWEGKVLPAAGHDKFSNFPRNSEDFRFRGFFSIGTLAYVWGRMYRKSFLEEHEIIFSDYTYAEDKLFNMQCYICGAKYTFLEKIGYMYRKNDSSISYQYNPEIGKCWLGICKTLKNWIEEQKSDESEKYDSFIWYTLSFAAFFDSKMQYTQYKKRLRIIRKTLKNYRQDELGKEYFQKYSRRKNKTGPEQKMWRVFIKGFTLAMRCKCYLLLSVGIKLFIDWKVDERLSDTGIRK